MIQLMTSIACAAAIAVVGVAALGVLLAMAFHDKETTDDWD